MAHLALTAGVQDEPEPRTPFISEIPHADRPFGRADDEAYPNVEQMSPRNRRRILVVEMYWMWSSARTST